MTGPLVFQVKHRDSSSRARTGVIATSHGKIDTPAFMPVATQAAVKGLTSQDLVELGAQLLICNTYHLMQRPGADRIARLGGLHSFMAWDRVLATDSGGFQVFSLGAALRDGVGKIADIFPDEAPQAKGVSTSRRPNLPLCKIDDDGVTFQSHLDGAIIRLTPEISIEIQHKLGADLILAFDECTSPLDTFEYTRRALERTHRWAARCLEQHFRTRQPHQSLIGVVQGGAFRELREQSAKEIGSQPFDGLAIGGSLGRSKREMHAILEWTIPLLPEAKPRHLLGIGEIEDLINAVERGIDLFDCAAPTRWARNGALLLSSTAAKELGAANFRLVISNARFAEDQSPIDPTCPCPTCRHYSRAYLHHLHRARELTYYRLATIHNLSFMMTLMSDLRGAIEAGRWQEFRAAWL